MNRFQDAFISYGRADSKAFTQKLYNALVEKGLNVWFDFEDIPLGVDYQNQIDEGIETAHNFLYVIAPHSVNSPYCGKEVELALRRNKRIIPILHVEQISRETWQQRNPNGTDHEWAAYQQRGAHSSFPNMHPEIAKINWIYCRENLDDFDQALQSLLAIMQRQQAYVHQHTLFLGKALEWERQQKQSRYLLIGEERQQAEAWLKVRFKEEQPPCIPTDLHCEFITESIKNGQNLMTQVFLSYAGEEMAIMEQVRQSLRREGFTVWTNKTDIQTGVDFQEAINRGIEEADNIVYLLSPAALGSTYCQQEIDYALKLNKRIIPLLVQPTDLEKIPDSLRMLQYIDLTDNVAAGDYTQDESDLLRILRQDAAYYEEHKVLLTKALKWERQQRNPTILLRGYNLQHAEAWLKVGKQRTQQPPLPIQEEFIAASLQQPPGLSLDVFVSYSRADSDFARKLNDALQTQGKTTWFDQESIASGSDFQQEINRGIENSNHFLFVISPNSISSPYCADEVEYAQKLNKRIVTILHRPVNPADLHPVLAAMQWIDFNKRDGEFSANFAELLRTIDTDPVHLQTHTRLLVRAIEWNQKERKESLLLRDDELASAEQWLTQSATKEPKPTELQQTYIANSRSVEDANQQATKILKAAATKGKRLVTVGAITGGIGLLVAGGAGFLAWQSAMEIKVADIRLQTADSSEALLTGKPFQALLTGLQSGNELQTQFKPGSTEWNHLEPRIMAVLQHAMNGISEKTTFSGHQDWITTTAFSPDGKTIASGSFDKTIKLWDVATGKSFSTLTGHQDWVADLQVSPDGKTLVSGSYDRTIKLWDVATGKFFRTLKGHRAVVTSVRYSPDSKTIVSSSYDKTIKLWDGATGKLLKTFAGHIDGVTSVDFSPSGKTIASSSADKTIKLWDRATGNLIRTLEDKEAEVTSISFSPDGKTLASGSADGAIQLWDVATGERLNTFLGHQEGVNSLRFSRDGKMLASGSNDKTIRLWDVETGSRLDIFSGHQGFVTSISFSPDGKTIASGSRDKMIKLWQLETGKPFRTLEGHQEEVTSLTVSPDGKTIASGSRDKTIKLWDAVTGQSRRSLSGHQGGVTNLSFSPDGKAIASGSVDKTVKLWDVATGKTLNTFQGTEAEVESIGFSPDGKTIAAGSADDTLKLWDVATGKPLPSLKGHESGASRISFSPDGKIIAAGSWDKTIELWDVAAGQHLRSFKGHQDQVHSISFSPDSNMIASASGDGSIKLWNVATGKELHSLEGHESVVTSVRFSPDGKTIISGSWDKTIKLWDVATAKLVHTFKGHDDNVTSIEFSPDGKTIASASSDKTIRLWIWDFDRLMAMSCDWIRQYLITVPSERRLCPANPPMAQKP